MWNDDALTSALFFFNDTATTEIYTLSLHDALPICHPDRPEPQDAGAVQDQGEQGPGGPGRRPEGAGRAADPAAGDRSEEHTSELQSRLHLVCRLLLEKKKGHH